MTKLNIILGAGCIGGGQAFSTTEKLQPLLDVLKSQNINMIDCAAIYPTSAPGTSEKVLGEAKAAEQGFTIDTKIFVGGPGCLSSAKIRASVETSLKALCVDKVNILYCHAPDYQTPLEEIVRTFDELYKAGTFMKWGISNFPLTMLVDILQICTEKNYVRPSVYQGQYNPICRVVEAELFPLLKANGIAFNAYSPLAGGFFTGNLTKGGEALKGTRLENSKSSQAFVYNKSSMHVAFKRLSEVIEPLRISSTEAALRWITYHSPLGSGDGIILGCSKSSQIEKNVEDIGKGPLPEKVVEVFEMVWDDAKSDAPGFYATEKMCEKRLRFVRAKI